MTGEAPGPCPGCGRPFPMTRTGRRYCSERCRDRAYARAAAARRSAAARLERIAAKDREFLRTRTSRGLGYDPGPARRGSPVPWEGDG